MRVTEVLATIGRYPVGCRNHKNSQQRSVPPSPLPAITIELLSGMIPLEMWLVELKVETVGSRKSLVALEGG